ncbi:MAG: phospholipid carrier-dependent glycosyltransferase, partial [Myxococcota bacterium]
GLLGGALLLTTFDFAWMARRAQLDVLLALFETLALVAFWRLSEGMGSRRRNLLAMHAALGAALLVKGPVGFLVPVLVMATTLAARRRLRTLPSFLPLPALLLSLGPALAWLLAAAALAPPEWLDEAVGRGVLQRFFTGSSHVRPFYYYLYHLPGDFLPWTLLWPLIYFAGRRSVFTRRPEDAVAARAWIFLLAWVGASVVFFSVSAGKRGVYLMPTFPALALLCADALLRTLEGRDRLPRALSWGTAFLFGLLAIVAAAASLAPFFPQPDVHMARLSIFGLLAGATVLLSILAWRRVPASAPLSRRLWIPVATVFGIELATFLVALPALDPGKSPRPIAVAAARWTGEDGRIGLYGQRPRVAGLRYYGDRPVVWEETLEGVERFIAAGGRVLVVRQEELEEVQERIPVEVLARFRSGRRGLLLVGPRGPQDGSRVEDPPPAAAQDSARMADP